MALREEGFWDEHYERELSNYEEDGDEGEVWFGKKLSLRIVDWLLEKLVSQLDQKVNPRLVDIGCGNGYFLVKLIERITLNRKDDHLCLFTSDRIIGLDYSEKSIELSRRIASAKGLSKHLRFEKCNFLDANQLSTGTNQQQFDYIVDIGTFDAICLLASETEEKLKETKLTYLRSLNRLVKPDSVMIFASCNHTQEEILSLFELEDAIRFDTKLIDKIETPKLKFGGHEGSQVTCLILRFS